MGEYAVYVTAWNSAGYVDSNVVYFKVIERPWYSSLTPVDLGEQFDSVILAKSLGLHSVLLEKTKIIMLN